MFCAFGPPWAAARADVPVVTVLCDYEDDSVAASIGEVQNAQLTDCDVRTETIPARGQRSLAIEIGAGAPGASATCDLRFRLSMPFEKAERVATHAWVNAGRFEIAFRIRDARGALYESASSVVRDKNRWTRVVAALDPAKLKRINGPAEGGAELAWPIEIHGFRVTASETGRQTLFLDDLEVEHAVPPVRSIRGDFRLSNATHIYAPGETVKAAVVLENLSRKDRQTVSVQLAWLRADGTELTTSRANLNLPASGPDFRSLQAVDFSQAIAEPGLYRLVARASASGWIAPAVYETTIAVTPSNRGLPRGRATFFGLRTNLLREPLADQRLEIEVARDLGVQLLAIETPWSRIEPRRGAYRFALPDTIVDAVVAADIAPLIWLTEPPEWLAAEKEQRGEALADVLVALARHYGQRVKFYCAWEAGAASAVNDSDALQRRLRDVQPQAELLRPPVDVAAATGAGSASNYSTRGDLEAARRALESLRPGDGGLRRDSVWSHEAAPLAGSGELSDAVDVLRFYTSAAAAGVGSVIWFDLRDDSDDPRYANAMRGLVRRDFSPKTAMVGYANAVAMLAGLVPAGTPAGVPPEFDASLFIAGNRQVTVLFPKPSRIPPAAIAPAAGVPGQITAYDFERREMPPLEFEQQKLVATLERPVFVVLQTERAQKDAQLRFRTPWLNVPRAVLCGETATFKIDLMAPADIRNGVLQIVVPDGAPVQTSFTTRAVNAKAGERFSFDVELSRTAAAPPDPVRIDVRFTAGKRGVELPVDVRGLTTLRPAPAGGAHAAHDSKLADLVLVGDASRRDDRPFSLYAQYERTALTFAFTLPRATSLTTVRLGVSLEGAPSHVEIRVDGVNETPTAVVEYPANGKDSGVRARTELGSDGTGARVVVDIPATLLGADGLTPGQRLLIAASCIERSELRSVPPQERIWGRGLGGSRSTAGYEWVVLSGPE
ncbi:MAG: hypothetical protein HRF50_17115 [Phycisphaerae bacterium]|jgi:hypothetical protein